MPPLGLHNGPASCPSDLAIFFEHKGKEFPEDAIPLNKAAAEVYEKMFSEPAYTDHVQDFWHKNAGLVYYNLHSLTQQLEYGRKMKHHWQKYIDSGPDDPQVPQILSMINRIKG